MDYLEYRFFNNWQFNKIQHLKEFSVDGTIRNTLQQGDTWNINIATTREELEINVG